MPGIGRRGEGRELFNKYRDSVLQDENVLGICSQIVSSLSVPVDILWGLREIMQMAFDYILRNLEILSLFT